DLRLRQADEARLPGDGAARRDGDEPADGRHLRHGGDVGLRVRPRAGGRLPGGEPVMSAALPRRVDVVVCGGGHNGLAAAALLARRRLDVRVLEQGPVVGGAVRTERPFARAPDLGVSTGAYLLGLMPPEIMAELGLELELLRRDPHYFLPTTEERYLLFGSDEAAVERQIASFFSEEDAAAHRRLSGELAQLRDDLGPSWLAEP